MPEEAGDVRARGQRDESRAVSINPHFTVLEVPPKWPIHTQLVQSPSFPSEEQTHGTKM